MPHSHTRLLTHAVFGTKGRRPLMDAELRPRLFAYLGGIARELGGKALGIGGTADHVHLLVEFPPMLSIADALRVLKTNSSRCVHRTWPQRKAFEWQAGYGAFSVSESNQAAVLKYIANQETHHRRMSFKEELIRLLQTHGVPYDERYLEG